MTFPDFLIIGSPKAGSTALHVALAQHPDLFLSNPKEPKYFMCAGARPDPAQQKGPGDAHSAQEWVWDRAAYEALFAAAPAGTLRGESTPFYLWDTDSHQRIRAAIPDVKMIAVIRDPIDRAYSNWGHLWCDGLEPQSDFLTACRLEPTRIAAGYAPFWRYLETGLYGQQLEHLFEVFPREQVFVLRYRQLIDNSAAVLDEIAEFLGVRPGIVSTIPRSNVSNWVPDTGINRLLQKAIRAGAVAGAHLPPQVWRQAQRPLLAALHRGNLKRPRLSAAERKTLLPYFEADNALLGRLTGVDYSDWLGEKGRGAFTERQ
ncbi:MAG: sulfotransferase [Nakamurella sp.]